MSRSPYDASSGTAHPLSLSRSPRVPRSLDSAVARARAPQTAETPDVDRVLVETLVSSVKLLQRIVQEQGAEIVTLKKQVKDINGRMPV